MNMHEVFRSCRTVRRFLQEDVPEEDIREALDIARIGSSAQNKQSLYYLVIRSAESVEKTHSLVSWAGTIPNNAGAPHKGEEPKAYILLVIKQAKSANPYSDIDVGIAVHTLAATLWEQGIGSCILANIQRQKIRELFDIPPEDDPRILLALGKPAGSSVTEEMQGDDFTYYMDEDRNFHVPKRQFDSIVRFV